MQLLITSLLPITFFISPSTSMPKHQTCFKWPPIHDLMIARTNNAYKNCQIVSVNHPSRFIVMFVAASWKLAPNFNPTGLILVSLSICDDWILPNAQEHLFKVGSNRSEITIFTNLFPLISMTVTTFTSGDLVGVIHHAMLDRTLSLYIVVCLQKNSENTSHEIQNEEMKLIWKIKWWEKSQVKSGYNVRSTR